MKNQSNCKMCGASGKITAAKNQVSRKGITVGHFSYTNGSCDSVGRLIVKRVTNGDSMICPHCRPDKYMPHVGKK